MELKLTFSCTIIFFYFTGINATSICKPQVESYSIDENRCESACTYQDLLNFQLKRYTCICNNGFARNKDGNCIDVRQCDKFCAVNEVLDKEAIRKNAPCSKYCSCKEGFYRFENKCVECVVSAQQKSRCEIFDSKTCSCSKCKSEYAYCNGRCSNNNVNCRTFDANKTCKCINCETGYRNDEGSCVRDIPYCTKYNENGTCSHCQTGRTVCNNNCVTDCIGGKILNLDFCLCVCPPNTELCGSKCVDTVCKCPWQYFSPKSCRCECKEGAFPCKNTCQPFVNNCSSYKNDTCKCESCNPGYKLCNEMCVPFQCNVNEYFVDAICQCDCKEGFFRNEKGVCSSTETSIDISVFYKLFLEIIYSFLPSGYGFCHRNEFYSSWAIKVEDTCRGLRTPNPTERCFCKSGFIRDLRTNTCMKVCPLPGNPCDTHEIYECGPERYCRKKPVFQIEAFARVANIEADLVAAALLNDKPLIVDEDDSSKKDALADIEVEIGKLSPDSKKNKKQRVDAERNNSSRELVDIDVEINSNESSIENRNNKTRSTKKELLDVSATVDEVVSADVEVGRTSKNSKEIGNANDPKQKRKELLGASVEVDDLVEGDVEIGGTADNKTRSRKKDILDVSATVKEVASVDVEVGGTSKQSKKNENANDPKFAAQQRRGKLLNLNVDVDDLAKVDLEIGKAKPQPTTEVNVEEEIGNENIFVLSNEDFCGYHCSEGYGRVGSVCKKCDTT